MARSSRDVSSEGLRLTRRQILKLGAAGTATAASGLLAARAAVAEDLIRGGGSVSRTTGAPRRAVPSTCGHCPARCGILGFVEEGRLVKIEGNPRDPNSRGRLCARGHAGVNRLYDPDRVLFPMERVGRRGEGKWVRLSWEQAYEVLEQRMGQLQATDPKGLLFHAGAEAHSLMARRFVAAVGSEAMLDEASLHDASRATANRLTLGSDEEVTDVSRARYILNFGGNPYENHQVFVPFVQRLVDARMGGARLITFDPRLSLTAGRSDEWFPILPGSDGLVALAIANVIVQQGLHDEQFLSRWTDIPLDRLPALLSAYSPEAAEAASGMRADDIRRIATEFARVRPVVAMSGGGVSHQRGAVDTQRAVILLNAVVGGVGVPGGYCPASMVSFPEPDPQLPGDTDPAVGPRVLDGLANGGSSVGIYVTCMANPAYSWPDSPAVRKALLDESRVPYLVAIDTNLTETAMLADLVLPAATYLESWGLESPPAQDLVPYVTLRQPVVAPRGESLGVDDILLTMGTRLGGDAPRFFPFPTVEGFVNAMVSRVPGLSQAGGLALLKEQGVWHNLSQKPQHRLRPDGFTTPSGKLEFGSLAMDRVAGIGQSAQVASTSTGIDPAEFSLVTYRPNVHYGEYTANCWWLAEIAYNNTLLMNPSSAQRLRIKQGQRVRVTSPVDSVEVQVRITPGIHPQVVALSSGFGHEGVGRVARAERFKSEDAMTMHIWWGKLARGANASSLLPYESDIRGRGLVWMDTRVRVDALG